MIKLGLLLFPLLLTPLASRSGAAEIKTTDKGIAIDAGSFGEFTLGYPTLIDATQQPAPKLVETHADGATATLRYDGGGTLKVSIGGAGEVTLTFADTPADVKSVTMEMLIDIAFNKGGKWRIGDVEKPFPREKPASPHLHQGNATKLTITNAQGRSLSVSAPQYSFLELTDNREWNWGIFAFKSHTPFMPDQPVMKLSIVETQPADGAQKKLVDSLGQSTLETWPDKMKSADNLKSDAANDASYYAGLATPKRDAFGGLPGSGERLGLQKTGFFHIEQRDGKSWLVDPAGNAFFHTGVCGFNPSDDFTNVKGREDIYEWLPQAKSEFSTAFRDGDTTSFSFYVANTIRKFGQPYDHDAFAARMIERVRKFGFNSMGAFSTPPPASAKSASFPYVLSLAINEWEGIPRIPGAWEVFDPFDDKVRTLIEQQLAKTLPQRADDPLLIGYFIINEPRYDELPKVLPSLNGQHACKRQLVKFLRGKYRDIAAFNTAWSAQAASFDELIDKGLASSTSAATDDIKAFTGEFLEASFALVSSNFRKHDTHHSLLGTRLQPVTIDNEQLCRIEGRHVDVMSFNYYTYSVDKALLRRVHDWTGGKPIMLSEFYWSSPRDSGLTGGRELKSQQERGLMYRHYVEAAAALGFVIGIEWFTLIDQATTGRWFSKYSGESANTGLFSVTDRPWKSMLEEMAKTNHGIYEVLLGGRAPFAWDHAPAVKP